MLYRDRPRHDGVILAGREVHSSDELAFIGADVDDQPVVNPEGPSQARGGRRR